MRFPRRYVLVDRDGTINAERDYLSDPAQLELLPNAVAGLRRMRDLGLGIVVVTNQSGIARGYFDETRLAAIHARLADMLAAGGVEVAAILHCPHGPDDGCDCRKPRPGLVAIAVARFGFDPADCFVIGDKAADVELGRNIGAATFLVETGYGGGEWRARRAWPDFVVPDLLAAAQIIEDIMSTPSFPLPTGLPPDAADRVRRHLLGSIETKRRLLAECQQDILAASALVVAAMRAGRKLMICGNGGSAADSQHIAAEFVSTLNHAFPRPALPAIALTTDTSLLTANANDFGFDGVFERQVQALGQAGDVLMGISTSGNSVNVLRAMTHARAHGLATIGLTGGGGGLAEVSDVVVKVPSQQVQFIQESHIAVGHVLCDLVERALFGTAVPPAP